MGRRSDNPLTILVMGILLLAGFGVSLVLLTTNTPVLQLKPLVAKEWALELRTRFRTGSPTRKAAVELILEREGDWPAPKDQELAVWALERYLALVKETETGTTSIEQLEVLVEGRKSPRFVLTLAQYEGKLTAEQNLSTLPLLVEVFGFEGVEVKVLGYSKTGAKIGVTCRAGRKARRRPRAMARRAVSRLQTFDYLGSIEFEISGADPLKLVGGRDTPLSISPPDQRRPRRRGNKAPLTSAAPAQVHSEGR